MKLYSLIFTKLSIGVNNNIIDSWNCKLFNKDLSGR